MTSSTGGEPTPTGTSTVFALTMSSTTAPEREGRAKSEARPCLRARHLRARATPAPWRSTQTADHRRPGGHRRAVPDRGRPACLARPPKKVQLSGPAIFDGHGHYPAALGVGLGAARTAARGRPQTVAVQGSTQPTPPSTWTRPPSRRFMNEVHRREAVALGVDARTYYCNQLLACGSVRSQPSGRRKIASQNIAPPLTTSSAKGLRYKQAGASNRR